MTNDSFFVHEKALCESREVGRGTRIWAFSHVMQGARVGADCNLGEHVFVESGAVIGDRCTIKNGVQVWDKVVLEDEVFLGPMCVLTNDLRPRVAFKNPPEKFLTTLIQRGATIGAGAVIVCGTTIGTQAFVAAGAVVTRDVAAHALVVGNPARRVGWACACGETLPDSLVCGCGRGYRLISEAEGLEAV